MLQQIFSGSFNFYDVVAYLVAVLLIIFLILPFHEWAHAFVAYLLGDKEAKSRGRLTLNPISHIDMVGALAMIFVGFGWAKPVPINPNNFKKPKLGMALCALAGPVANLLAAYVGLIIYYILAFAFPSFFYLNDIGLMIRSFLFFMHLVMSVLRYLTLFRFHRLTVQRFYLHSCLIRHCIYDKV